MNQVFLVDDEFLAVEGLRLLVDWERLGARVCGVAYDGKSALEQIVRLRPDVVLTDIRMPGMNGLDLIAAVRQVLPSILFVVISGYNEFEYARSALRLGVVDYIDKPVTVEKIEEVYQKVNRIFESRENFAKGNIEMHSQFSLALEELLRFPQQVAEMLPGVQEKYRVDLEGMQNFLIAVCRPSGLEAKEKVRAAWDEIYVKIPVNMDIYLREENMILFCTFESDTIPEIFFQKLRDLGEKLTMDGSIETMGAGGVHSGITELEYALKEGEQALRYAEYFDEPFMESGELDYHTVPPVQVLKGTNNIVYCFRTGDYDQAMETVDSLLNLLLESDLELELFYSECLKLVHVGLGLCRETGKEFDRNGEAFRPHMEIQQYNRASDVADWVFSVFQDIMKWMKDRRSKEDRRVIIAKEYIDAHYSEAITLPYLASLCGMQPTYFSMLFKEQVGQTYIKYINFVRMEQAKQLLVQGVKVKEIYRQVGFQNYRYFCNKFKSLLGCTPEQYRSRANIKQK